VRIAEKAVAWIDHEVMAWIESRIKASRESL
jgi:predicted DNA-binding transcriptional regulator AlpA